MRKAPGRDPDDALLVISDLQFELPLNLVGNAVIPRMKWVTGRWFLDVG